MQGSSTSLGEDARPPAIFDRSLTWKLEVSFLSPKGVRRGGRHESSKVARASSLTEREPSCLGRHLDPCTSCTAGAVPSPSRGLVLLSDVRGLSQGLLSALTKTMGLAEDRLDLWALNGDPFVESNMTYSACRGSALTLEESPMSIK